MLCAIFDVNNNGRKLEVIKNIQNYLAKGLKGLTEICHVIIIA